MPAYAWVDPLPARQCSARDIRSGMINVIIADEQAVFRAGTAKVLAVEEDIRIVGQPTSREQLLNSLDKLRTHVLLLATSYLPLYEQIKELTSRQSTALLMLAENGKAADNYMQMGAHGVVYRSVKASTIVQAVRRLARGEKFIQESGPATSSLEDSVGEHVRTRLTGRELRVVAALIRGYRNREIADLVGTSEQTIKNALRSIYDKTGVSDRLELALFVLHHRALAQATAAVQLRPAPGRPAGTGPGRPPNLPSPVAR